MDTTADVWTVPAVRMKTLRAHRVPLCGRAIEILDPARTLGNGGSPLVFPGRWGRQLDGTTLTRILKDCNVPAVAHGVEVAV